MHCLYAERPALHFLDGGLLIGDSLHEEFALIGLDLRMLSSASIVLLKVMRRMMGCGWM
jgi:hypothetical protein